MAATEDTVVCLPGILAHAEIAFKPLWLELMGMGNAVMTHDYTGWKFEADREADAVLRAFAPNAPTEQLTIVGASLGGMLVPFIVDKMSPEARKRTRIILIDSPTGVSTFKALPNLFAGAFGFSPSEKSNDSWYGRRIMNQFAKGLPEDEYITLPDALARRRMAGRDISKADWNDWVKAEAERGLSGHSFTQWYYQLQWMIEVGKSGRWAQACKSLAGMDVTYLACMSDGNDVVAQPQAMERTKRYIPHMEVVQVPAVHCGFLQNQPEFADALGPLLWK